MFASGYFPSVEFSLARGELPERVPAINKTKANTNGKCLLVILPRNLQVVGFEVLVALAAIASGNNRSLGGGRACRTLLNAD